MLFPGITGSPFIVNCNADVQMLFEVRQFQFSDEEEIKFQKEKDIFKPKRVFVFESKDQELDCTDSENAEKRRYYLTKTTTDWAVKWLHGDGGSSEASIKDTLGPLNFKPL